MKKTSKKTKALEPEVLPAETEVESEWDPDRDAEQDAQSGGSAVVIPVDPTEDRESDLLEASEWNDTPGSRAVSATDPLRRYLEEVRRYPLLTPEQELDLALRLRDKGDLQAAKALISANLRLVVKIAFEYKSMYTNVMDLIQEGNVGLMKAVSKYDPDKGAKLGYYASWWIRSYILKYLLDNFRLVKIGTTQAQKKLFYHLIREKERLEAQGILPTPKLLANTFDVSEKDVLEMETRLGGRGSEMSIDAPMGSGSDGDKGPSQADFLADGQESVDERLARGELVQMIRDRLPAFEKTLNPKEKSVLKDRLLNDEPATLQEVADKYGLTRERARQIEAKVVFKLKEFLSL